jgi:hypothetical protein
MTPVSRETRERGELMTNRRKRRRTRERVEVVWLALRGLLGVL